MPNGPAREPERGSVIVRRGWLHQVLREGADGGGRPDHLRRAAGVDRGDAGRRACHVRGRPGRRGRHPGRSRRHRLARRVATSTRTPRSRRTAGSSGLGRIRAGAPGSRRRPRPSTSSSARARSSATSCATTAPSTGSRTSPRRARPRFAARRPSASGWRPAGPARRRPVPGAADPRGTSGEIGRTRSTTSSACRSGAAGGSSPSGDAVHATSPSAGQGASLALEDAITLAKCLRDQPAHAIAFAEYQRLASRAPTRS